jgi:hypothetical protein
MPGFGSGGFGSGAFGSWNWSREVLFELSPENYRIEDANQGGVYEEWALANGSVFDASRYKIRDFGELRDPLLVRTRYDETTTLRLGDEITPVAAIEQSGITGSVNAGFQFTAQRGRFTDADLGKLLVIDGSSIIGNNRTVKIAQVASSNTVATEPSLAVDAGPLRWSIREETTSETIRVKVSAGDVELIQPGWVLSDSFADFEVISRSQFPTDETRALQTEREGADLTVNSSGQMVSSTAAFNQEDVGKRMTLAGSPFLENRGKFEISEVLSATVAVLDTTLLEDATLITWAIRRQAVLELSGEANVLGIREQGGIEGVVVAPDLFSSPIAEFSSLDVGKRLTLRADSDANNGTYEILAVNSGTEVQLDATLVNGSPYFWEVRATTGIGDFTRVEVRAPGIIHYLATDSGIEIDNRESEEFQRRWVASASRWIDTKGDADTYVYLGALTGFDVEVTHLWRVSQDLFAATAVGGILVGENTVGRYGEDGALTEVVSKGRLTSATAAFVATDVGLSVEISGSVSGNDGLYEIETVISATVVEFRLLDPITAPEVSTTWRLVRIYSEDAPARPVYDEINSDLMTQLKGAAAFTVDKWCFEPDWSTTIGAGDGSFAITATTPPGASAFPITYTITAEGDLDVVTGFGEGQWKLTDVGGVSYFFESVPVLASVQSGVDGLLTGAAPVSLTSASATFTAADVGRKLTVGGSGSGNDGTYTIGALIGPNEVTLILTDTPFTPDANNSSLTWDVQVFEFEVNATDPPDLGAGTFEYLCPLDLTDCDYCGSSKILVEASTSLLLTQPFERLFDRLNQAKPKHVEFVQSVGQVATSTVTLTATGTVT